MKNIKIDEKKNDPEVNISVSKSNKKDNKFETMESKKENIMKIPKVFQLKYNNLAEKKSQVNDTSDKSNSKITTNPSVDESNEKRNIKNYTAELSKSELNVKSNIIEAKVEEINNKDLLIKNNHNSTEISNKLDKPISLIMPVNRFNSILKQKIDIIDHVPAYVNKDLEKEDSFRVNIVTNDVDDEKTNKENLIDSPENSQLHTFKNKNSNYKLTQNNKGI